MLLLAVMLGYILGVAPVVVYFLWQNRKEIIIKAEEKEQKEDEKKTTDILSEWLYGKPKDESVNEPVNEKKPVNQEQIFKEYIGG